jgi:hypothetical protein
MQFSVESPVTGLPLEVPARIRARPAPGAELCTLIEPGRNDAQIVVFERLEMPLRDLRLPRNSLEGETSTLAGAPQHLTEGVALVLDRACDLGPPVFRSGGAYGSHGRHVFSTYVRALTAHTRGNCYSSIEISSQDKSSRNSVGRLIDS